MKSLIVKVIFDRKGKASRSADIGSIELSCYKNGRIYFSTGIKVPKAHFSGVAQGWVAKDNDQYKVYNVLISNQIQKLVNFDNEQMLKDNDYHVHVLKQIFKSKTVEKFTDFFEDEYKDNPKFEPNTIKNYKSTLQHLQNFGRLTYFSDLTYTNVESFNRYLVAQKLKDTTIQKYHKYVKKVINEAIKKGYFEESKNPYKNMVIKAKPTEKICLTVTEIKTLENLKIKDRNSGLQRSLDMFLFSIYTGVRFSDLQQVSQKTVSFKPEGVHFEYEAIKTKKKMTLNLSLFFKADGELSKPEQIIHKYKDFLSIAPFKIELPPYNRNLKDIAELAKITKNLSSHIARHTFLTFMADKVSTPTLMKMAQHSDIATTMQYVHLSEKMKQEELKKVNWEY